MSALIVCMILVMVVMTRLFGGMLAPFKEIVKAAIAASAPAAGRGLVVMLVAALVMPR